MVLRMSVDLEVSLCGVLMERESVSARIIIMQMTKGTAMRCGQVDLVKMAIFGVLIMTLTLLAVLREDPQSSARWQCVMETWCHGWMGNVTSLHPQDLVKMAVGLFLTLL